eukprot:3470367-Rhodomonas_salina.2
MLGGSLEYEKTLEPGRRTFLVRTGHGAKAYADRGGVTCSCGPELRMHQYQGVGKQSAADLSAAEVADLPCTSDPDDDAQDQKDDLQHRFPDARGLVPGVAVSPHRRHILWLCAQEEHEPTVPETLAPDTEVSRFRWSRPGHRASVPAGPRVRAQANEPRVAEREHSAGGG